MSDMMTLHDARRDLHDVQNRFNALAQVAGANMPKYLKPGYMVPVTVMISGLAAAAEAKFDNKAKLGNTLVAAIAYGVGIMSGDNADLREGAYAIAKGLGSAAASIEVYDRMTNKMAATPAPPASLVPIQPVV